MASLIYNVQLPQTHLCECVFICVPDSIPVSSVPPKKSGKMETNWVSLSIQPCNNEKDGMKQTSFSPNENKGTKSALSQKNIKANSNQNKWREGITHVELQAMGVSIRYLGCRLTQNWPSVVNVAKAPLFETSKPWIYPQIAKWGTYIPIMPNLKLSLGMIVQSGCYIIRKNQIWKSLLISCQFPKTGNFGKSWK